MSGPVSASQQNPRTSKPSYGLLVWAGLFMLVGISFLIFLGRDTVRLRGMTLAELDLVPLLNAEKAISDDDRKGMVTVLYFWAAWNKPSTIRFEEFVALQKEFLDSQTTRVVSIACEKNEHESKDDLKNSIQPFLQSVKADELPVYCDPAQFSRTQISRIFSSGGFSYPTIIVLDAEGRIEAAWRGKLDIVRLKSSLRAAQERSGLK